MSIFITILCIGFVIFIHELGHLLAAKRAKVGVSEFAVGMGPKLFSFKYEETTYSLRAFPIGGFIKAKGLDDLEDCPIEEDYREKSILSRSSIIVAGSFMNILLGLFIYILIIGFSGIHSVTNVVDEVLPDYPAEAVGLMQGDQIESINGNNVTNVANDLINVIKSSNGESIEITYRRNDLLNKVVLEPVLSDSETYVIGVSFSAEAKSVSIIEAVKYGVIKTWTTVGLTFISLKMLFTGQAGLGDLAGPIGIVQIASSQLSNNLSAFFNLMAFISISLGVINLFPFPVLDGGHLLFLLVEALRGRPLSRKAEVFINNTAASLLIGLMIFIIFNDLINWGSRVDIIKEMNQ